MEPTVNVRLYKKTWKRFKVAAAKRGITALVYVDEISKN